jgi:hypothetical protein
MVGKICELNFLLFFLKRWKANTFQRGYFILFFSVRKFCIIHKIIIRLKVSVTVNCCTVPYGIDWSYFRLTVSRWIAENSCQELVSGKGGIVNFVNYRGCRYLIIYKQNSTQPQKLFSRAVAVEAWNNEHQLVICGFIIMIASLSDGQWVRRLERWPNTEAKAAAASSAECTQNTVMSCIETLLRSLSSLWWWHMLHSKCWLFQILELSIVSIVSSWAAPSRAAHKGHPFILPSQYITLHTFHYPHPPARPGKTTTTSSTLA